MSATPSATTAPDARAQFLALLADALQAGTLVKLVLARHVGVDQTLQRIIAKPLQVKGQDCLSLVYRHQTRDITRNLPLEQAQTLVAELLPECFRNAHLFTAEGEVQLGFSKKGKPMLQRHIAQPAREQAATTHDREKKRYLELSRPFLRDLGVTDAQGALIPSMSRKWKQINKFIEVFDHALASAPLTMDQPLRVADFGSGKGYLTFAMHDYLRNSLVREALVTGVELRQDMVDLCNAAAARLEHPGLEFQCGDVRSVVPEAIEVMIALHACDIATDYAIHTGIRCNAAIIMCSPCCHKQIRPQLHSPGLLQPMLQYGLHLGQQAEMLTDSLRALYLEACGYETKVFEFISLEHTNKNKMILAVKRRQAGDNTALLAKIEQLKAFYGVKEHCLETLLRQDGLLAA
ncbi:MULTISPECIES: class I SAM-dependent methyltransferase [Pseudomonas]|uniref:Methyltransferase n=2 Tax=Pseudomonas TaxID=286 RepID=A0AAX0VW64_9PSED|nr:MULTISPECIES: SAM-dependent methyltransferase [Pseudomonas]MDM9595608.1 SAM-dependent methyltransferase [Pseudomonas guariconensis]MDM9608438.1 SAM-dependent methyltransferase [Pseudomonas guariconensis]MDM9613395.1 SAM-dependent methyltransferase [Pseudomonas guariconensis]PLV18718.1 methyltransferase [Pseudomonas guariconensis]PLV23809.1 methyltransferase [Pseudomonas guariconensis]